MALTASSPGFPAAPLDVTVQGVFYQTPTALFRNTCSLNKLFFFNSIAANTNFCFYKKYLQKFDVQFGKFFRRTVGPPPGKTWSAQWHDIFLHAWNMRVDHWARAVEFLPGQGSA